MEFSAEQNVSVPAYFAFRKAVDHEFFARLARERGVKMDPLTSFDQLHEGCGWRVVGTIRNRKVDCEIMLEDFEAPDAFALSTSMRGVDFVLAVEIENIGPNRCRIYADLGAEAKTMAARLAMKAASLTSNRLEKKYRRSVRRAAQWLEAEYEAEKEG